MTWKKLYEKMAKYRHELVHRLHRNAGLRGMYVAVWNGQAGFTLEAYMRIPGGKKLKLEVLGSSDTIRGLFADARDSFADGTLAKYLKKPKTSGSRGKKKHK